MMSDFAFPIALLSASALAWDFGRRYLAERAASRVEREDLAELRKDIARSHERTDTLEHERKLLNEDWLRKFRQLENDWQKLKEHSDSQLAGTLAAVSTQRGFNR